MVKDDTVTTGSEQHHPSNHQPDTAAAPKAASSSSNDKKNNNSMPPGIDIVANDAGGHGAHIEIGGGGISGASGSRASCMRSSSVKALPQVEIYVLRPDLNTQFPKNEITTSKYTALTFLPLNLLEQFRRVSNIYFLMVMICTLIPGATSINPYSSIIPFMFVLGVAAVKDGYEDFKRHRADARANAMPVLILRGDTFVEGAAKDVCVGDVVKYFHGEEIRADSLILNTSLPDGLAYIETANLDGETNAKTRRAKPVTVQELGTVEHLHALCAPPTSAAGGLYITPSSSRIIARPATTTTTEATTTTRIIATAAAPGTTNAPLATANSTTTPTGAVSNNSGEEGVVEFSSFHNPPPPQQTSSSLRRQQSHPRTWSSGTETNNGSMAQLPGHVPLRDHVAGASGDDTAAGGSWSQMGTAPSTPAAIPDVSSHSGGDSDREKNTLVSKLIMATSASREYLRSVMLASPPQAAHHEDSTAADAPRVAGIYHGEDGTLIPKSGGGGLSGVCINSTCTKVTTATSSGSLAASTQSAARRQSDVIEVAGSGGGGGGGGGGGSSTDINARSSSFRVKKKHQTVRIFAGLPNPNLALWHGKLLLPGSSDSCSSSTTAAASGGGVVEGGGGEAHGLGIDQFIPRGCVLRNTEWVMCLTLYTGNQTKMMLNLRERPTKTSVMESKLNRINVFLFSVNQAVIFLFCGLAVWFMHSNIRSDTADAHHGLWYVRYGVEQFGSVATYFWRYLNLFALVSYLIPLSLYVSLEFVKATQIAYIAKDDHMAIEMPNGELRYPRPKTSNLNVQLAHVRYIFTDKTGTLTENMMKYVGGYVDGKRFDAIETPGGLGLELIELVNPEPMHNEMSESQQGAAAREREPTASYYSDGACAAAAGGGALSPFGALMATVNTVHHDRSISIALSVPVDENGVRLLPDQLCMNFVESEVSVLQTFRYLLTLSLCHNVVCFDKRRVEDVSISKKRLGGGGGGGSMRHHRTLSRSSMRMSRTFSREQLNSFLRTSHSRTVSQGSALLLARQNTGGVGLSRVHSRTFSNNPAAVPSPSTILHHPRTTSGASGSHVRIHGGGTIHFGSHTRTISRTSFATGGGIEAPPRLSGSYENVAGAAAAGGSSAAFAGAGTSASSAFPQQASMKLSPSGAGASGAPVFRASMHHKQKVYEGQSLDEVALVRAALENGFELMHRSLREIVVDVFGTPMVFDIIAELEFTPQRKMMSIILKRNREADAKYASRCRGFIQSQQFHNRTASGAPAAAAAAVHQHGATMSADSVNSGGGVAAVSGGASAPIGIRRKQQPRALSGVVDVVGNATADASASPPSHLEGAAPAVPSPLHSRKTTFVDFPPMVISPQDDGKGRGDDDPSSSAAQQQQIPSLLWDTNTTNTAAAPPPVVTSAKQPTPTSANNNSSKGKRVMPLSTTSVPSYNNNNTTTTTGAANDTPHSSAQVPTPPSATTPVRRDPFSLEASRPDRDTAFGMGEYLMLTKGADNAVFSVLDQNVMYNKIHKADFELALNDMASTGLRTLVLAYRNLTEAEVNAWLPSFQEALTSEERDDELHVAYSKIEQNLTLIGTTAVEDKLQDGVPETLEFLLNAEIVIWMLTGDKRETAVTIAATSGLMDPIKDVVSHIDVSRMSMDTEADVDVATDAVIQQLNEARQLCVLHPKRVVLIIDGISLQCILRDTTRTAAFFDVGSSCRSAVCCRMTPLQKAQIVKLFQENTQGVALAIGDGANDVSMIQESRIGIGIMGLEGAQAELASDFAIPKFRHLKRLLVVHGRHALYRESQCILYSIYKNVVLTVCLMLYCHYNAYTGVPPMDSWALAMFNVFYVSVPPLLLGIADRDIDDELAETHPNMYPPLAKEDMYMNSRALFTWLLDGCVHGLFIYFLTMYAIGNELLHPYFSEPLEYGGFIMYIIMLVLVNLVAVGTLQVTNVANVLGMLFSFAVIIAFTCAHSVISNLGGTTEMVGIPFDAYRQGYTWVFMIFFNVGVLMVWNVTRQYLLRFWWPENNTIVAKLAAGRAWRFAKMRWAREEARAAVADAASSVMEGGQVSPRDMQGRNGNLQDVINNHRNSNNTNDEELNGSTVFHDDDDDAQSSISMPTPKPQDDIAADQTQAGGEQ